jgi:DNA-binding beta-propeller fold protein YncE
LNSRKLLIGVSGTALFALVVVLAALAATNLRRPVSALPPGGTVVATLPLLSARDVVAGFGSIWVSSGPGGTVARIDPTTDAVTAVIYLPDPAWGLAVGTDSIWLTSAPGNRVTRIDPATNRVVGSLTSGERGALGITVFDGYVWVANHNGGPTGSVAKIDPAKMQVVDRIYVGDEPDGGPTWIAAGAGAIWVGVQNIKAVVRIDPSNDTIVAIIPDGGVCRQIVADDQAVWVAGGCDPGPGVTRIDPATNTVTRVSDAGGNSPAIALGGDSVWYGTTDSVLGRINAITHRVVGRLRLPGPAWVATVAFGFVWVTDLVDGLLFKVKPN